MSTLILEIPDDLAETLKRLPEADVNNFALSALRRKVEEEALNKPAEEPLRFFPQPGFARGSRFAREAKGDFRTPAQILKDLDSKS